MRSFILLTLVATGLTAPSMRQDCPPAVTCPDGMVTCAPPTTRGDEMCPLPPLCMLTMAECPENGPAFDACPVAPACPEDMVPCAPAPIPAGFVGCPPAPVCMLAATDCPEMQTAMRQA